MEDLFEYEPTVAVDEGHVEYEQAVESPSCENALGFIALCASCPLVRMFGECPKGVVARNDSIGNVEVVTSMDISDVDNAPVDEEFAAPLYEAMERDEPAAKPKQEGFELPVAPIEVLVVPAEIDVATVRETERDTSPTRQEQPGIASQKTTQESPLRVYENTWQSKPIRSRYIQQNNDAPIIKTPSAAVTPVIKTLARATQPVSPGSRHGSVELSPPVAQPTILEQLLDDDIPFVSAYAVPIPSGNVVADVQSYDSVATLLEVPAETPVEPSVELPLIAPIGLPAEEPKETRRSTERIDVSSTLTESDRRLLSSPVLEIAIEESEVREELSDVEPIEQATDIIVNTPWHEAIPYELAELEMSDEPADAMFDDNENYSALQAYVRVTKQPAPFVGKTSRAYVPTFATSIITQPRTKRSGITTSRALRRNSLRSRLTLLLLGTIAVAAC